MSLKKHFTNLFHDKITSRKIFFIYHLRWIQFQNNFLCSLSSFGVFQFFNSNDNRYVELTWVITFNKHAVRSAYYNDAEWFNLAKKARMKDEKRNKCEHRTANSEFGHIAKFDMWPIESNIYCCNHTSM